MKQYDAIIIGGGINSLIAASLLGQAGNNVILFESKNKLGGMAAKEEYAPGFKCNLIYDYIRWIDPRLIKKLDLHNYGLQFNKTSLLRVALEENGHHIAFDSDPEKTAASISQHSSKDADKWVHFTEYINGLTQFLEPIYKITPPKFSELGIKDAIALKSILKPLRKHGSRGFVDILRAAPMMMPELMDEWFESKLLRGSLASSGITHLTQGPYAAATVLNFLHQHMFSNGIIHNAIYINGGTEMLAQSLFRSAQDSGVEIRLNSQVTSINYSNNICTGITTADNHIFNGTKIISGLDPTHTFLRLINTVGLSPTFRTQLQNIKYRGTTARVHFALNSLPKIINITAKQMKSIFGINPSIEYLEKAYDDVKYGRISTNPYIEFSIPTLSLPNYAPLGKHVLSATIQYVPYHLRKGNWSDDLKNQVIQKVTQIMCKYIPNFANIIEKSAIMTPRDFETSLGLTEGNLNHGEMTLDQFFFMRPTLNSAQYITPMQNLFLCGPGTHPGGGLHGANALNAIEKIFTI